jgi:hypothetical protein
MTNYESRYGKVGFLKPLFLQQFGVHCPTVISINVVIIDKFSSPEFYLCQQIHLVTNWDLKAT